LETSLFDKLILEKRIYDILKPLLKTDIQMEDLAVLWDIFDNTKIYGVYNNRPLPVAVDSSGRLRVVTT